ncbi:hypothetical protein CC78DRAFT_586117 [Lojkania enalia]|uniref:DUF7730 domain-containing protein n=1 Tax=Lojkania enalia TaxID=147567 RepID=A0A9P4K358_9PLEO|nr:hypothetical protein CC78DRAFT_586117 [Didymosphaeria enalia]
MNPAEDSALDNSYSYSRPKRGLSLAASPIRWVLSLCGRRELEPLSEQQKENEPIIEVTPNFYVYDERARGAFANAQAAQRTHEQERVSLFERRRIHDQHQSPLFAALPAELRVRIYEMIICETKWIHLKRAWNEGYPTDRLVARDCTDPDDRSLMHQTCACFQNKGRFWLSILLCYRRINREAISALYSINGFQVSHLEDLSIFNKCGLLQLFPKVKNVSIQYSLQWRPEELIHLFLLLSLMPNLHDVYLRLYFYDNVKTMRQFRSFSETQRTVDFISSVGQYNTTNCNVYLFVDVLEKPWKMHYNQYIDWDPFTGYPIIFNIWSIRELIKL